MLPDCRDTPSQPSATAKFAFAFAFLFPSACPFARDTCGRSSSERRVVVSPDRLDQRLLKSEQQGDGNTCHRRNKTVVSTDGPDQRLLISCAILEMGTGKGKRKFILADFATCLLRDGTESCSCLLTARLTRVLPTSSNTCVSTTSLHITECARCLLAMTNSNAS